MNEKIRKIIKIIAILAFEGILVTSYLTYLHFEPSASNFCNFGDQFNCDLVNKSIYSVLDLGFIEIPVSIMGLLAYIFFFVVSLMVVKKFDFQRLHQWLQPKNLIAVLMWLSFLCVGFSLYLTYIEAFVLQTWCIFCLIQQILIFLMAILFFVAKRTLKKAA